MKTKIKRHSRSVMSVILAVSMLVSCMMVGLIATEAAYDDSESVGWNGTAAIAGDWNSWSTSADSAAVSSDSATITFTTTSDNQEFKIVNVANNGTKEWFGNGETLATNSSGLNLPKNDNSNCKVQKAGTYTITCAFSSDTVSLTVTSYTAGSGGGGGTGTAVDNNDLIAVLNGTKIMFYAGNEFSNSNDIYLKDNTNSHNDVASVSNGNKITVSNATCKFGLFCQPSAHYWTSDNSSWQGGDIGTVVAGKAYCLIDGKGKTHAWDSTLAATFSTTTDTITPGTASCSIAAAVSGHTINYNDNQMTLEYYYTTDNGTTYYSFDPSDTDSLAEGTYTIKAVAKDPNGLYVLSTNTATLNVVGHYYIGGRFTIKNAGGNYVFTGTEAGDWKDLSNGGTTNIQLTGSGSDYSVNTRMSIAELSTKSAAVNGNKDPLFIIHDTINTYATVGNNGLNFENYRDPTKLSMIKYTTVPSLKKENELMFADPESNSDGTVTIHFDPVNKKAWYTVENETPALAASATLTAEPASQTAGYGNVLLTAGYTSLNANVGAGTLTYTFYKNGIQIQTGSSNTCTVKDDTVRTNTYKVVISTSVVYSGTTKYRSVSATTNVKFTNRPIYRTDTNLFGGTDAQRATAVTTAGNWYSSNDATQGITGGAIPDSKDYKFTETLAAGNTFEFALARRIPSAAGDLAELTDRVDEFFVDVQDSMYCDVTSDSITVTYTNGEETERYAITTYKVTPRENCSNPEIHIDTNAYSRTVGSNTYYYPGRIYAKATYNVTAQNTVDNYTGKTVTYYFAEDTSFPNTTLSGAGVRIAYWNNSKDVIQVNNDFKVQKADSTWSNDWKDAIDVNGVKVDVTTPAYYDTTNDKIKSTGTAGTDNKIYVDMQELFDCGFASATTKQFLVYKVELPVWATSFVFLDTNDRAMDTRGIKKDYGEYAYGSLLLNPNRVYLFYQDDDSNHYKYTKAVVLDKGLWNSSKKNHVDTATFKANAINYNKDYSGSEVKQVNGSSLNDVLSAKYTALDYKRALYFGYFDKGYTGDARSKKNGALANFKISNNLAMRYKDSSDSSKDEKDERYYFASAQGLVAEKLDTDNLNSNGFPLLQAYSDNNKTNKINMPLFDYSALDQEKSNTANPILDRQYLGVNFPMYESNYNGIKTYSFDSSTDKNRTIKGTIANGKTTYDFAVDSQYRIANNDLGYQPFIDCNEVASGVDKKYGNATELDVHFYMSNSGQLKGKDNTMQDIVFNFTGDDDVWVYVDGVLVLDLGGDHKASAGSINFSDMKVYYKTATKNADDITSVCSTSETWPAGKGNINTIDMYKLLKANGVTFEKTDAATEHTFQMFYMERGHIDSNMSVSFNLPQASGLNVRNTVTYDSVNPGLLNATKYSANKDYFTFGVDSALNSSDSGHDVANVASAYSNVKTTGIPTKGTASSASPSFPAQTNVNHLFETSYNTRDGKNSAVVPKTFSGAYPLSRVGTTVESAGETSGAKSYTQRSAFGNVQVSGNYNYVDHVPYTITDTLLKPVTAGDTNQEVVGVTSDTGTFRLLGTQAASFDDKFLPGTFVKVFQSQSLGEVDPSFTPIRYKSVADNNVGNYYITSYSIKDNHSGTWIQEKKDVPLKHDNGDDIYAVDKSSNTDNCFYFCDYGKNTNLETAAMTVDFYNDVAVGDIKITKNYNGTDNPNFTFFVKFSQVFGDTSAQTADAVEYTDLTYDVLNSDGSYAFRGQKYGQAGVVIKKGQTAVISGVPVETRYQVIEDNRAGSTLTAFDKKIYDVHGNEGIPNATPPHGYAESFNETQLKNNGLMGTSTNSWTASTGDVYQVNMIPRVSESCWDSTYSDKSHWDSSYEDDHVNQLYKSTSVLTFTNEQTMIKVMLKYYDRKVENGGETGIDSDPTAYTYRITNEEVTSHTGDDAWYVYDGEDNISSINYDKIVTYVNGKAHIENMIASYTFWPTNAQALAGIKAQTKAYYTNHETADTAKYSSLYSDAALAYHTDYVGAPVSSDARTDKWVCFKDKSGNVLNFDAPSTPEDYQEIATIEVWGYNCPKKYSITSHNVSVDSGVYSSGGLMYMQDGSTPAENTAPDYIVGNGNSNTLSNYLYNTRVGAAYWAHLNGRETEEQIAAENAKVALLNRPSEYFQNGYGLNKGYTGEYPAAEKDFSYEYSSGNTAQYVFAYWASDIQGKNKITTDYHYGYRITRTMDIYPVFVKSGSAAQQKSVSITAAGYDMYTSNDKVYRRINNIIGVYNVEPYDNLLTELTVCYVRLGTDSNTGKTVINPATIDLAAVKENYLAALSEAGSWGKATPTTIYIDVTPAGDGDSGRRATAYKYDVTFDTPSDSSEVQLNNKNRMLMTHAFNNDLFAEGKAFNKMLVFAAAKYDSEWFASENYILYNGGEAA